MLHVMLCHEADEKFNESDGSSLPMFMLIATTFQNMPTMVLDKGVQCTLTAAEEMIRLNMNIERGR